MNILAINWNPNLGIDLGFFVIRYYSLMYIIGFMIGYYILRKVFISEKVDISLLDPILTYVFVGTLLGARLGHVFFYDWNNYFKNHLMEILVPVRANPNANVLGINGYEFTGFQGLASHGAAIGIMIALILFWLKYFKGDKSLLWLMDRVALTIPFGGALIRIGNLLNSEIIGKPTGTNYGFIFQQLGEDFPRHPTQIYEASAYMILLLLMLYLFWRTNIKKYEGMLFGVFFLLLWVIRFFIEFYKEPQKETPSDLMLATGLDTGQLLSIPFAILGAIMMFWAYKKNAR